MKEPRIFGLPFVCVMGLVACQAEEPSPVGEQRGALGAPVPFLMHGRLGDGYQRQPGKGPKA
jgi:hypothetical protein